MLSEDDIEKINEIISMKIKLGDEFEGTEEASLLQDNFNDADILPMFHEMLTSSSPSANLHIFSFIKIAHIVSGLSGAWSFSAFDQIGKWVTAYVDTMSDFVVAGPSLLIESLVACYAEIVKAATAKYPFFQEFWNSMAHFTVTVYTNSVSASFTSLLILRELLKIGRDAKPKSDIQMARNRQTVFNYSIQLLEIHFSPNLAEDGQGVADLASLALETALELSDLVRSANFRILFAYESEMPGSEAARRLCEASLNEGRESAGDVEVDPDAVFAVEEGLVAAGDDSGHFLLAVESESHLSLYARLVETLRQRGAEFSVGFLGRLAVFTSDLLAAGHLTSSPDAVLDLAHFFALYRGDGHERPPDSVREALLACAVRAADSDTQKFSELYGVGRPNEERLTSLISFLYRFTFSELVPRIREEVSAILDLKKNETDQKEIEKASLVMSLLMRVAEQACRSLVKDGPAELAEELFVYLTGLMSEFIVPSLEQRAGGEGGLHFSDGEILASLALCRFIAEADEFEVIEKVPIDAYGDALRAITRLSHAALACVSADSPSCEAALAAMSAVCERKSDTVFIDNDWMLDDEMQIDFNVSTMTGFNSCSALSESLFFHELKQTQPRIGLFFTVAETGIYDLSVILSAGDEEGNEGLKEGESEAEQEARTVFLRILAKITGILSAFDKFCSQNRVEKRAGIDEAAKEKLEGNQDDSHEKGIENEERNQEDDEKRTEKEVNNDDDEEEEEEEGKQDDDDDVEEEKKQEDGKEEEEEEKKRDDGKEDDGDEKVQEEDRKQEDSVEEDSEKVQKADEAQEEATEEVLNEAAVSIGKAIVDSLFPATFDTLTSVAEILVRHSPSVESDLVTPQFVVFGTRVCAVLRRQLFDLHSSLPNETFKRLASFACAAISRCLKTITESKNAEDALAEESGEEFNRFRATRAACRSILMACVRLSAGLLGSDAVTYGAFLLYDDASYREAVFAAADAAEFFTAESLAADDSGSEFGIRRATEALLMSLYARHVPLAVQKPGFERFDDFFNATLPLISGFESGARLLETLVTEFAKISSFNNGVCEPLIAAQETLDSLVGAAFDGVFLGKNSNAGSALLFGTFSCISEGFAVSIVSRTLASCPIVKRPTVSKFLDEIVEASQKRDMVQTRKLFEKFHSIWFNL